MLGFSYPKLCAQGFTCNKIVLKSLWPDLQAYVVKKQRVLRNLPAKELKPRPRVQKAGATGAEKPARSEPTILKLKLRCCLSESIEQNGEMSLELTYLLISNVLVETYQIEGTNAKIWETANVFVNFSTRTIWKMQKGSVDFSSRKIGEIAKRFRQFFLREKFGNYLKILSNFSLQK